MFNKKLNTITAFLSKTCLFLIPVAGLHVWAFFAADGSTDDNYARLTSPLQSSLVFGTSRAAHCIQPAIMNAMFQEGGKNTKLFNFAFNLGISPYGKAYYEAILKKTDTSYYSPNRTFIICVDPWAISVERKNQDNDSGLEEYNDESQITFLHSENSKPNFEYLYKKYHSCWGQILLDRYIHLHKYSYLHPDGWLEISTSMDSVQTKKRTKNRTNIYVNEMPLKYKKSLQRIMWLEKTIAFCKKYGQPIIVRLPVSTPIFEAEEKYMPAFDQQMISLSKKYECPYFNYVKTGSDYLYTDGNHMYKTSGAVFSRKLSIDIISLKNK